MSLNISLPAELENRVRDHVASGMYGSASEVIREALRLFEAYQTIQGLRSWPTSTPYLLFYLADEVGITVLRVLHHARDVRQIDF